MKSILKEEINTYLQSMQKFTFSKDLECKTPKQSAYDDKGHTDLDMLKNKLKEDIILQDLLIYQMHKDIPRKKI